MTKQSLTRRILLRGVGGACMSLPWLEFNASRARAQTAPKKLLLISVGHSMMVKRGADQWTPKAADLSELSPLLEPLAPHRARVLVPTNIENRVAVSGLIRSNGHNFSSRSLLTCMPHKEALDAAGNLRADRPECQAHMDAGGPSFDHVVAGAWQSPMVHLRVGGGVGEHKRSFTLNGAESAGESFPNTAFNRIFSSSGGAAQTPADRLRGKRKSILDAVKGNFDHVRGRLGAPDRLRLDQHADYVRQIEKGLDNVARITCESPRLTPSSPLPTANSEYTDDYGAHQDVIAEAQLQLATLALSCQATRVAHVHFTSYGGNTFAFLNGGQPYTSDWHGVVHGDSGTDEQRLRTERWFIEVLSAQLGRMAQTPDGTGSLLDNTLVLWISSLGLEGHDTWNMPILLAGNLGGARAGRMVRAQDRTLGDLYVTLFQMLGIAKETFGWTQGGSDRGPFVTGPLSLG